MTIEQALKFDIIPVIDLMGGRAVAAKGGRRDAYAPVCSALCPDSDPLAVARALLGVAGSRALYVADLDAILGGADQSAIVHGLADALPGVSIWFDAGFRDVEDVATFRDAPTVTPVLGSETMRVPVEPALSSGAAPSGDSAKSLVIPAKAGIQLNVDAGERFKRDPGFRRGDEGGLGDDDRLGDAVILSLDFDARSFRGPQQILNNEGAWPRTLIVMTLDRVGENEGPDLVRLRSIAARAPDRRVIAAGGVRDMADIESVADAGASGVLIASALHDRRIGQKEIAAFQGRRRSFKP